MKKVIMAVVSVIAVILLLFFFVIIFPFLGTKKTQAVTEFNNGRIIAVMDGMSQTYILDGGNREIALVDAGNSPDGKPVLDALAAKGYKASDVKAIFLTHGHQDHIAAAGIFTNAKIYALNAETGIAEGARMNKSPLGRFFSPKPTGIKVTGILEDGQTVQFGSMKIDVFSVPGHTEGSAVFLIDGILFMGDTSLSTSDGKIKHPVWVFSTDVEQGNRSLKKLAERLMPRKNSIRFIVFSHSGELQGLEPLIIFAETVK